MPKGPGPGRPKGMQNRATIEFREGVNKLIETATPKLVEWLEEIDDPNKRLDMVYKFAQFGYPLLARTEHTSPDGTMTPRQTINLNGVSDAAMAEIISARDVTVK